MWTRDERAAIAQRIKAERIAAGLTQQELADAADVTRRTVGAIEKEGRVPQAARLARIMRALGISVTHGNDDYEVLAAGALIGALLQRVPSEDRSRVAQHIVDILIASMDTDVDQAELDDQYKKVVSDEPDEAGEHITGA